MRRREFMLLSGAAAIWPLAARAQQSERVRRVGVLVGLAGNDPEMKERLEGLRQGLEKLGWAEGRNLRIDYRFAPAGAQARLLARELIALQPDVILTQSTPATAAMQQETKTIPSSPASPTRSVRALLRACRGRAAISPACCNTRRASPANGWRCSRKLHRI
jgi:putative ABC transport system substrate-binding protein